MFIAQTTDGKKISIEKAQSTENYLCPVCGNPVIIKAVNSDNVRTHFAHKRNFLCVDDWKHDMSEWHFDWQSKFPIDNREFVVEKDGIVHRADVLINNTVIEFQHSPISSEEFEARNSFYKSCGYRVVWLFDVAGKMKIDSDVLIWKRQTTLFSKMKTPIEAIYVQHDLPENGDYILRLKELDPKVVKADCILQYILPDNFLKEYGAIQDENVFSISEIFVLKYNQMRKRLAIQQSNKGNTTTTNRSRPKYYNRWRRRL